VNYRFYFLRFLLFIFSSSYILYGEQGIVKDRTPHPIIPLASYIAIDLKKLSSSPRDFIWSQVHITGNFVGLEKGIGFTRLRITESDSKEPGNIIFVITEMTQYDKNLFESIKVNKTIELYCMVESTLFSGETVVMVEKMFFNRSN
jgi:hypothetical protein